MGTTVPTPKQEFHTLCKKYRSITLANVASKMIGVIKDEKSQRPYRQTTEKNYEYNMKVHLLFLDFKQAFEVKYQVPRAQNNK